MTHRALLLWPPIGIAGMLLLGWAVGKGSTPVDAWFQQYRHGPVRWLTYAANPWLLAIELGVIVTVAMYRRQWRLARLAVVAPVVAIIVVELAKRLFDRRIREGIAYPSGHTTVLVIVMGFLVLVTGAAVWAVLLAIALCLIGMVGVGSTYHYFTDTIGALLLGTAIVCIAALISRQAPRET